MIVWCWIGGWLVEGNTEFRAGVYRVWVLDPGIGSREGRSVTYTKGWAG
jgi:hypothetical protein